MSRLVAIAGIAALVFCTQPFAQADEKPIPRSYPERCKYYLVKSEKAGTSLTITHKQVCPKNEYYSGVGFSVTEVSCAKREYKDLGYGDDSIHNIKMYPSSKWTALVPGSSKSDLVNVVCK